MGSSESKTTKSSDNPGCLPFGRTGGSKCEISIATLGLDNAGKTSIVLSLAKEPIEDVMPTVGFDSKRVTLHGQTVTLFDLGGGPKIRGIWRNYLAEVHGVLYVVDASDRSRIQEAAKEFKALCKNTFVHGKPMLILANKSDRPDAASEYELTELMELEEVVNVNRIPTKVQASTTISKDHRTLKDGMKWLYMSIAADWDALDERVKQDVIDTKEKQKAERRERMERIRKEREEREEREAAEGKPQDEQDGGDVPDGDPFQTLNDHLSAKAAETKPTSSKKKKKARTPRTSREGLFDDDEALSPKEKIPVIRRELVYDSDGSIPESNDTVGQSVYNNGDITPKKQERVASPLPSSFGDGLGSLPSRLPPLGGSLPPLSGSSPLKPIDLFSEETTTKKKKKRKKKTRISPTLDNNGLMPVEEEEGI